MKDFKELQELRDYYWGESCDDLYDEAEEELRKKDRWFGLKKFFGTSLDQIKDLQHKKFEEFFKKMINSKPKDAKEDGKEQEDKK